MTVAGQSVTGRVDPATTAKADDRIKIAFELDNAHLFDKETEVTITN